MLVATQRDASTEDPTEPELFPVACVVRVLRVIDSRLGGKQAIVVGVVRARLGEPVETEPAMMMRLEPLMDLESESDESDEMWARVTALA